MAGPAFGFRRQDLPGHHRGEVIHRSLSPNGRGLIHSIGRNKPFPFNPWIERRIFPGAYPPSLSEMTNIWEPQSFSVLDVENIRLHSALTLRHWHQRFEWSAEKIAEMFDESFVRAWRLYLASSIVAFETGWLQLFQVAFARPNVNDLPWSRAHLYQPPHEPGNGEHDGRIEATRLRRVRRAVWTRHWLPVVLWGLGPARALLWSLALFSRHDFAGASKIVSTGNV